MVCCHSCLTRTLCPHTEIKEEEKTKDSSAEKIDSKRWAGLLMSKLNPLHWLNKTERFKMKIIASFSRNFFFVCVRADQAHVLSSSLSLLAH